MDCISCTRQNAQDESIMKTNIQFLDKHKGFKLICGASLTHAEKIRDLAFLFSLAGANIIDVAPDFTSINAACDGISKAIVIHENFKDDYPDFNIPVLMVSLNAGEDPHFKTAEISSSACKLCDTCLSACSFNAISRTDTMSSMDIDSSICYGCGNCLSSCPNEAISLRENKLELKDFLTKLKNTPVTGLEIHAGSASIETLESFINQIKNIAGEEYLKDLMISFSLESARYNAKQFVDYANHIVSLFVEKIIIQVDGKPMSGSSPAGSTLQTLASAQILIDSKVKAYIILSGGVNHLTCKLAEEFNISHNGIAMGTYARKLLWPYLGDLEQKSVLNKATNITTSLVKTLEF